MRYKRVLIKLSGGALSGEKPWGFEPAAIEYIANEVMKLHAVGVEVGIVAGGGNIFKGELGQDWGIERAEADNIGMIGTIINSLMLRGVLAARSNSGVEVRVMTAVRSSGTWTLSTHVSMSVEKASSGA